MKDFFSSLWWCFKIPPVQPKPVDRMTLTLRSPEVRIPRGRLLLMEDGKEIEIEKRERS